MCIGSRYWGGTAAQAVYSCSFPIGSHAIGPQVSQAQNPAAGRGADDSHVLDRPVSQTSRTRPLCFGRQVHAPRTAEDVPEFQASLADRGSYTIGKNRTGSDVNTL